MKTEQKPDPALGRKLTEALRLLRKKGIFACKVDGGGVRATFSRRLSERMEAAGADLEHDPWVAVDTYVYDGENDYVYFGSRHPTFGVISTGWEALEACKKVGLSAKWDENPAHAIEVRLKGRRKQE